MQNVPPPLQIAASAALVATALWTGCQEPNASRGPETGDRDLLESRVAHYFRRIADLPDGVSLRLVNLEDTAAPELLQAELEIADSNSRRRVPLVVSRDHRFLIQGSLVDLLDDPYARARRRIDTADHPSRGSQAALVTLVAFVDFQCPFSARAYATLIDGLLPDHAGDLRIVFKHFPLPAVHPWAATASLAAACAFEQDPELFWTLADRFFREQDAIDADSLATRVEQWVARAGGDAPALARCIESQSAAPRVAADETEGRELGVRSTPTFFINGRKLEGARPFEELSHALSAALADAGPTRETSHAIVTQGPFNTP